MNEKISSIKQYIFVIQQLTLKEHKKKTDDTSIGVLWNVLSPLLYMIIMSVYYQGIIQKDIENFPVFVFIGITMLTFYRSSTTGAMKSLVRNKRLLVRTQLPTEIFIYQKILSSFKEMCYSAIALIPVLIFFNISPTWRIVEMIPVLLLTILIVIGIGEILAIIYVYFEDIAYFYSIFMTFMLFMSGVIIPLDHLPDKYQPLLRMNPIFLSIYISRNNIQYGIPSHWSAWVKLALWAVIFNLFGRWLFVKNKNKLIDKM